ncbi:uncharacterized protein [Antedon mediterranea]|uniref:uncharacterized protein n=1 Tax=Antedon mediterranea TaxID=105859 RepID=UPI003AF984B2
MEDEVLRKLLTEVAEIFYGEKLKSLQFLLSDLLKPSTYTNALHIFEDLLLQRHITHDNLYLLYDIIKITGYFVLQDTLNKSVQNFPDLTRWQPTSKISTYRIMLFKVANKLYTDDVARIKFMYTVRQDISDVWGLIMFLEKECKIENNSDKLLKLKESVNPKAGKEIEVYCSNRFTTSVDFTDGRGDVQCVTHQDHVTQELTSPELMDLARDLGAEWEQLAIILGLKKADLDHLKEDNRGSVVQAIFSMLDAWYKKTPGDDRLRRAKLVQALKDTDRTDLAEKVESKVM